MGILKEAANRVGGMLGVRGRGALAVGDHAPDFTLRASDGRDVHLADELTKGPVVLAFYPRAFTLGCTHELRRYTERQRELAARGARLFAISVDDPETLARFRTELGADFGFLSDPGGVVSRRYAGVSDGQANRATVTISKSGVVTRITAGVSALFPGGDIAACSQLGGDEAFHA